MNVDDVHIVGATSEEILEILDRVLGLRLCRHEDTPSPYWSCGLPGYPTTWISLCEGNEDDDPGCWVITVYPRHPINGQAVATTIFRSVTKHTDWHVTQDSDAFGIVAKRPPHRRRARHRWEPGFCSWPDSSDAR